MKRLAPAIPLVCVLLSLVLAEDARAQAAGNLDLSLSTAGEGPQTISRSFVAAEKTRSVRVRYQFITSEIPGGFFGTQFNDFYAVSIVSSGGTSLSETKSMNGLGLGAFDASGATQFMEQTLSVDAGDTVTVTLSVANVADGAFDSSLTLDFIEESTLQIDALTLNDLDQTDLSHFSAGVHPYFSGRTPVHGTIRVLGEETDNIARVTLEVIQGGGVAAVAELTNTGSSALLSTFGPDGMIEVAMPVRLFEFASTAGLLTDFNGTVNLRVRVEAGGGDMVTRDATVTPILKRYLGAARYPTTDRDELLGGDDWIKPSVDPVVLHYPITVGDISNMHGGPFSPHSSHRSGNDVDGWFSGYNNRDANTAATIIAQLNDPDFGSRISLVFVTFMQTSTDPFWNAIKDVTLDDGRLAREVIQPQAGHAGHFHWRIAD